MHECYEKLGAKCRRVLLLAALCHLQNGMLTSFFLLHPQQEKVDAPKPNINCCLYTVHKKKGLAAEASTAASGVVRVYIVC